MNSNKDLYLRWLWKLCFEKNCRVVAVFNEFNFCLGYLVMSLNRVYDYNEIYIHDLFILPEERKTKTSGYLYEAVHEALLTSDKKQLRWCPTVPGIYWEDKMDTMFGLKVNTIKYYTIKKPTEDNSK